MRRWIGGILLGITRWIGRLAWPLLALWLLSHVAQCSVVASTPLPIATKATPAPPPVASWPNLPTLFSTSVPLTLPENDRIGFTAAVSRGYMGAFTADGTSGSPILFKGAGPVFEIALSGIEIDVRRWLPHRRREDAVWVWPAAMLTTHATYTYFSGRILDQLFIFLSLLLASGLCFAVQLLVPRTTHVRTARRGSPLRRAATVLFVIAGLFVCWPIVEVARLLAGQTHVVRLSGMGTVVDRWASFNATGFAVSFGVTHSPRLFPMGARRKVEFPIELSGNFTTVETTQSVEELVASWFLPSFTVAPTPTARIPGLFLVAAFAIGGHLLLRHSRRRRADGGCPRCKYDLTGNLSGVCPECGTPVALSSPRREPGPIRRRLIQVTAGVRQLVWPAIAAMAVLLVALDVALLGAYVVLGMTAAEPIATTSITLRAWCYWGIVWLTIIAAAIAVLSRHIEPPSNARYRFVIAANLILIILLTWPVPPPAQAEEPYDGFRDAQQIAEM